MRHDKYKNDVGVSVGLHVHVASAVTTEVLLELVDEGSSNNGASLVRLDRRGVTEHRKEVECL
jgi:hypothetical protein